MNPAFYHFFFEALQHVADRAAVPGWVSFSSATWTISELNLYKE